VRPGLPEAVDDGPAPLGRVIEHRIEEPYHEDEFHQFMEDVAQFSPRMTKGAKVQTNWMTARHPKSQRRNHAGAVPIGLKRSESAAEGCS
jgi:hypothetical protein